MTDIGESELTNQGKVEYELDLDNIPSTIHRWIERGDVVSCEGAGHPSHRHFKVKAPSEVVS